jgi:hypothetical protein
VTNDKSMEVYRQFTENDSLRILEVKERIQEHIDKMIAQPWFAPEIAINWNKVYLAGGAIASLLQYEKPKDWDFYCEDKPTMEDIRSMLLAKKDYVKNVDEKYSEVYGIDGKMITTQAITMEDGSSFITMTSGKPEIVKISFDYVHCLSHYYLTTKTLYISPATYQAAVNKRLVPHNSGSIKEWRTKRFLDRGYTK